MERNEMGDSAKRAATVTPGDISTRCCGLHFLEGEMLALVGVSAGLKASLALSTCCVSLRDTLASPMLDKQLFGGLYAALAGVDNPADAFLQPPPRRNLSKRHHPSSLPARSSTPECHYPNSHVPVRLRTAVGRAPSPPNSPSPLEEEADAPELKRARSPSYGYFPPEAIIGEAAAAAPRPNDIDNPAGCLPHLRAEEGRLSTPVEAQTQRTNQRLGTAESNNSWKMRLKEDMATGREPSKTFVFAGQSKGKQDVLLAVVRSTPPVIAITCTTDLSLFSLDGTRLPVVAASPQRGRRSSEIGSTTAGPVEDSEGEGEGNDKDDAEGASQVPAEPHQRDIRCLAASPTGDMVATGSLDCTIRVRSVPGCDWVRRLRGHEAGVRCLAFHRTRNRLVSADSLGMIAAWDVFPVSRRLCKVQGHFDSVQVLTWTSGGERLASGALDGSVVVWSISAEGTLVPVVTHGGLCQPYRLVAIGRCLAFTSSASPSMLTGGLSHDDVDRDKKRRERSCGVYGGDDGLALPVSKGAHISVVGVGPTSPTKRESGRRRVSTGLARLQHLVAGKCLGTVMLSQSESWAEDSDSSADEEDALLGGGRVTYRPPRLCRIVTAERITSFEDFDAAQQSRSGPRCEGGGGGGGGGGERLEGLQADWVKVSRCWSAAGQQPERPPPHHVDRRNQDLIPSRVFDADCYACRSRGGPECDNKSSSSGSSSNSNTDNVSANGEDLDGGAFCTCAVFVGRTLFLGYDTGFIYAHRAYDGRRLYRLSMFGSVVHLVEAKGSLFAYASSGVVSRWSWGDE